MQLDRVLAYYGGKEKHVQTVARKLNVTSACVYGWIKRGAIPYQSQLLIEVESGGRFKAKR